ncbi:MAG: hypothetical protein HQK51_13275 [Oligoflexia bacterium]|nr:hypothetical protein [Oligoflexia bacterium]
MKKLLLTVSMILIFFSLFLIDSKIYFNFNMEAEAASVVKFFPEGEVIDIGQVQVNFSDAMIPFGSQFFHEDPFKINCVNGNNIQIKKMNASDASDASNVNNDNKSNLVKHEMDDEFNVTTFTTRWSDQKVWVLDFRNRLKGGSKCSFELNKNFKDLNGQNISGKTNYNFNTGGPNVIYYYPHHEIEEKQYFILVADTKFDNKSFFKNSYLVVEGLNDKISLVEVIGKERTTLLRWLYDPEYDGNVQVDRKKKLKKLEPRVVVVKTNRQFPADTEVKLVWGRGITAASGVKRSSDYEINFKVKKEFYAEMKCTRDNANASCNPLFPLYLSFTSPINWEMANSITLKINDKLSIKAKEIKSSEKESKKNKDSKEFNSLEFPGPFLENTTLVLEVPKTLKDINKRKLNNVSSFPLTIKTNVFSPLVKFSAAFGMLEAKAYGENAPLLPVTLRSVEKELLSQKIKIPEISAEVVNISGGGELGKALSQKIIFWLRATYHKEHNYQMHEWQETQKYMKVSEYRATPLLENIDKQTTVQKFTVPQETKSGYEVIGIPLKEIGFYVVELNSKLLGNALLSEDLVGVNKSMYVATSALVTNLAVHLKKSEEGKSSLVWVTSLNDGKSVAGAKITIRDCDGDLLLSGVTASDGTFKIAKYPENKKECKFTWNNKFGYNIQIKNAQSYDQYDSGEFVFVEHNKDISFVHTSWNRGIESWRFNINSAYRKNTSKIFHTVIDRKLLKKGETVSMNHFARQIGERDLEYLKQNELPSEITITHQGSDKKYQLKITWDVSKGKAISSWKIPADTALGTYDVMIDNEVSGNFMVEDFRVPLTSVSITSPITFEKMIRSKEIPLSIYIQYLSGGGIAGLPVKLRYYMENSFTSFNRYNEDELVWANGELNKETVNEKENDGENDGENENDQNLQEKENSRIVRNIDFKLDNKGMFNLTLGPLASKNVPQTLVVELDYHDPNGEIQTIHTNFKINPASRLIGIKNGWQMEKKKNNIIASGKVVDLHGKAIVNSKVRISLYKENIYSHRKRLVGGFYAYKHHREYEDLKTNCEITSDQNGHYQCEIISPEEGSIIVEAETYDENNNKSIAHTYVNIYNYENEWFDVTDNDRIDLIPEKKKYNPGEVAKVQVKMPFKEAEVLVTLEHQGVIDAFVKHIERENPIIEVPIKKEYVPNIFISTLVVRGRVQNSNDKDKDKETTFTVDLAKPAYKMGLTEVEVGYKDRELKINIIPDKDIYQVREKGELKIKVSDFEGSTLKDKVLKDAEVAIAIVDEGLLELAPNDSWDILHVMYPPRSYAIRTCTAQTEVIGKRHFGQKAYPSGGGGGQSRTRELFDTLLYYNPKIKLDSNGEATVDFTINDSITKFRVFALAYSGTDLFGSNQTTKFSSTQDLLVFAGIAPIARLGDSFDINYTLKNNTDKEMQLIAKIKEEKFNLLPKKELSLTLAPNEVKKIDFMIRVPTKLPSSSPSSLSSSSSHPLLSYLLEVVDKKTNNLKDSLRKTQQIFPVLTPSIYQSLLEQLNKNQNFSLVVDKDKSAIKNEGGLEVIFKRHLINGLEGVYSYMQNYPWSCFEQRLSRTIALDDKTQVDKLMEELPSYISDRGLLKYYPSCTFCTNIFLTNYFVYITDKAGISIPLESKNKIMQGLKDFIQGRIALPEYYPKEVLEWAKIDALNALYIINSSIANLNILSSVNLMPEKWPMPIVLSWYEFLLKNKNVVDREKHLKRTENILRARLSYQGTTIIFNQVPYDNSWFMMSSTDVNALRFLSIVLTVPKWKAEIPKLVKGSLARLKHGHWDLTTANAWGVIALKRFSEIFESEIVTGETWSSLGKESHITKWNDDKNKNPPSHIFNWSAIDKLADKNKILSSTHRGSGNPWMAINSWQTIPLKSQIAAGFFMRKVLIPLQQKVKGKWSVGDVLKVRLEIQAQSDIGMVVVADPIPAGASHMNPNLRAGNNHYSSAPATNSSTNNPTSNSTNNVNNANFSNFVNSEGAVYEERLFDSYRAYFDRISKGNFIAEYIIRLNTKGEYQLTNSQVEAMYTPEMQAKMPNAKFVIFQ